MSIISNVLVCLRQNLDDVLVQGNELYSKLQTESKIANTERAYVAGSELPRNLKWWDTKFLTDYSDPKVLKFMILD